MRNFFYFLTLLAVLSFGVSCNKKNASKTATPKDKESTAKTVNAGAQKTAAAPSQIVQPATAEPVGPLTTIEFDSKDHDFGNMKQGDVVKHVFKFKNTGKAPLLITGAKGSCGCTVPEYPKEAIAPGKSGEINVQFNSKGKANQQTKTVTLQANTDPNPTILTIRAMVEVPPTTTPADK